MKDEIARGYSMRIVSRITGLTPDTIRAWERRYSAVVPKRTKGKTRRYSSDDIRRLILLREATMQGHSIREMAVLSDEQLKKITENETEKSLISGYESGQKSQDILTNIINEYLSAINVFEVRKANAIISRAASFLDASEFVMQIVVPILREAGKRWSSHEMSIAQEHLVTSQLKSMMHRILDNQTYIPGAKKVIIATPSNHLHEFGIMVAALLVAVHGMEPIFLGPNLPEDDILNAVSMSHADLVILGISRSVEEKEMELLKSSLKKISDRVELWVGIPPEHSLTKKITSVRYFNRFEDLDLALAQISS